MLYYFLKYISKVMMRVYFGKVYVTGLENVPRDKPLVLAANHQSAFIEPVLIGGIMPFPIHFMTRGDVFVKRYMWFFKWTNQIPIFRFKDGFSSMKKNMDSFQHVYDALKDGARVIIFCEGHMKWEKKLHSLQLGASRLALGAYRQETDLDIYVQPIGINYENHLIFRRYVKISFGQPIRVSDHTKDDASNQRTALKSITAELAIQLQPHVIHIASDNHYALANDVLSMFDNEKERTFFPLYSQQSSSIQFSVAAAAKTKKLDEQPGVLEDVKNYSEALSTSFTYRDYALHHRSRFTLPSKFYFYCLVIPLAIIGIIIHGLPMYLSNKITMSRTNIPEFVGSVKSSLGVIFGLLNMIILSGLFIYWCWSCGLAFILTAIISGLFAMYYWDRKNYWKANRHWTNQGNVRTSELLKLRTRIIKSM